jgi:hypothetical protein
VFTAAASAPPRTAAPEDSGADEHGGEHGAEDSGADEHGGECGRAGQSRASHGKALVEVQHQLAHREELVLVLGLDDPEETSHLVLEILCPDLTTCLLAGQVRPRRPSPAAARPAAGPPNRTQSIGNRFARERIAGNYKKFGRNRSLVARFCRIPVSLPARL